MKIKGVVIALILSTATYAQQIDENLMERDLKVAEGIIGSLMNPSEVESYRMSQVNGNYIPSYGVIFNIPANSSNRPLGIKLWDGQDGHIVIGGNRIKKVDDGPAMISGLIDNYDNYQEAQEEHLEEMMITFLTDYADLIGQLKPSDKIMIKTEQRLRNVFVLGSGGNYSFNLQDFESYEDEENQDQEASCCEGEDDYILTAEVVKSDLSAYRSGRLDREGLIGRITIQKSSSGFKKEPELELLSSIFHRLYKADLSDTYFATSAPSYNRIANFGVIYDWKVYSSNIENGKHNMPTIDKHGLTVEERNSQVEELYPLFIDQFKKQLIEYGRTLKGLDKDEILMFKIRLTQCQDCSIPTTITASVKQSVLEDYERQKIDVGQAAYQVKITEKNMD